MGPPRRAFGIHVERIGRAAFVATTVLLSSAASLLVGCEQEPAFLAEHLRRGDEALAQGDALRAMSAYDHARELAPTSPRVQRAMMWARVHLMADSPSRVGAERLEDLAYEAQVLLATEKLDAPKRALCLAAQGNVLARRGDVDGAKVKLAQAIEAHPASAIAHAALGTLLLARREQAAEARTELELALQHDAASVTALAGLAQLALADGDLQGASARLEAALRRRDDPAIRATLGRTWLQLGKHAEAVAQLERATTLDPRSADAWSGLGQALLGAGRAEEAERALRTAMSLRPDEATAIALGFALARLAKPEQALGVFGQVLGQNASAAPALYGAGVASEGLGRPEQALEYYRRVLALPLEGPQKPLVADLQKEARGRVSVMAPASSSSSAASSSPAAAPSAAPTVGPARAPR